MNTILNTFSCVPPCKTCRESGECAKRFDVPVTESVMMKTEEWVPNRLPMITLPCGCRDLPWPLMHRMGDDFDTLTCDIHGTQKIPRNGKWCKNAKKEAAMYASAYEKDLQNPLDIPPY